MWAVKLVVTWRSRSTSKNCLITVSSTVGKALWEVVLIKISSVSSCCSLFQTADVGPCDGFSDSIRTFVKFVQWNLVIFFFHFTSLTVCFTWKKHFWLRILPFEYFKPCVRNKISLQLQKKTQMVDRNEDKNKRTSWQPDRHTSIYIIWCSLTWKQNGIKQRTQYTDPKTIFSMRK